MSVLATRHRDEDAAARRLAQTVFDRPLLLEAGAGTGKTSVLVARVCGWCLGPGWERAARLPGAAVERIAGRVLRGVVAITFTEAAAAEMAARVAAVLRAVRDGRPAPGLLPDALPSDPEARVLRANALLSGLDQLTVCTIHAWCRRLLARHPLEARLHPAFEVDADETRHALVVREVVEAHLARALRAADADLLALARRGFGPVRVEAALRALVAGGAGSDALAQDPFAPERVAPFLDALRDRGEGLAQGVEALAGASGSRTRETAQALAKTLREVGAAGPPGRAELERLRAALSQLWSDDADLARLRAWGTASFGKGEASALGPHAGDFAAGAAFLSRALRFLLGLDPELLDLARRVLGPLLAEARRVLRERGIETFDALLRDARDLVRGPVAARVRAELDQLLVDEFQDTDRVQCELLRTLALEGPAAGRPGLFLVGDPKQSIYGWRSADLRAYHDFKTRLPSGSVHSLRVNFRSPRVILDEVARLVAPVMHERAGVQAGFEALLPTPELEDAPGFRAGGCAPVEHWVSWGWQDGVAVPETAAHEAAELEADALADHLAWLHAEHGVSFDDVAVLLRSTGDLDVYLGALREAGVPYVVERDRTYYQRREVIEAQALVRAILDPNDHLALLTWLRSAAVGVPDAALLPLWKAGLPLRAGGLYGADDPALAGLRARIDEVACALPTDVSGLARVAGWPASLAAGLEALARARASFDEDPADVFVEKLRALFALEATEACRYLGAYRVANLERLFRKLVQALEESGGSVPVTLAGLRAAVSEVLEEEEGRPREASDDAVHVMTIHRAKGLDFGHVFLVQHHKGHGGDDPEQAAALAERDGVLEYWLLDRSAATPGLALAERDRDEVAAAEQVRTLYVATTRAKERLVLVGRWPARDTKAELPSHAQLLRRREGGFPDFATAMDGLAASGESFLDAHGARWVFPALRARAAPVARPRERAVGWPSRAELEAERLVLAEARARAETRSARPFRSVASAKAEELEPEAALLRRYGDAGEAPARDGSGDAESEIARAVGTAVHRALERFDLSAPPEAGRAAAEATAAGVLSLLLGPEHRSEARERAHDLLRRFADGPLRAELGRLERHIVARELPVLLPPASPDTGPVGFVAGAIDLVYRDPETEEWVVVDYKTDRVETDEDHAARARSYAPQGDEYGRALQEALALESRPRFELWFIRSGRREVIP